jgi:hypothetical protein
MNTEEQNGFLLNLLHRLYFELGVYRVFVEYGRLAMGEVNLEKILREARENKTLREHVDSYFQGLQASLHLSGSIDPNQALREFLTQLGSKGKPN